MDASEKRAMGMIAQMLRSRGWSGEFGAQILEQCPAGVRLTGADAIEVITAALAPPTGYVLVPEVMTEDMEVAFAEVWFSKVRAIDDCEPQDAWAAALAVRPEVP